MRIVFTLLSAALLTGCSDDNDMPVYGKSSQLPVNCRAYVQEVVDAYRTRRHSTEDLMYGLESNCGLHGKAWKNNRDY